MFYENYVRPLLAEASQLGISPAELCDMIMTRQNAGTGQAVSPDPRKEQP
jgi:hypothetical protein